MMDNNLDPAIVRKMTKDIIKAMPVWQYFEEVRAKIELLEHDLKSYLERLDEAVDRSLKLPKINLTNRQIILPPKEGKDFPDPVYLDYVKTSNGYKIHRKENEKEPVISKSNQDDDSIGIRSLEATIERNQEVLAMVNPGKPWVRCKVKYRCYRPRGDKPGLMIRVETLAGQRTVLDVSKYSIARTQSLGNKLKPTKRVIAGISDTKLLPGIIGNEPCEENKFRYLILMDGGSASYYKPEQIYPIVGQSSMPWLDSRYLSNPSSLNDHNMAYIRYFFSQYPKRHIVSASVGDPLELTKNGNLVSSRIVGIDCDTIRVLYRDNTEESLHRGSPRLLKREEIVSQQLRNVGDANNFYKNIVIWAYEYFKAGQRALEEDYYSISNDFSESVVITSNPNKARKSTTKQGPKKIRVKLGQYMDNEDTISLNVLTKGEIDSNNHKCTPNCLIVDNLKTEVDVQDLIKEFRNVSDLKVPLILGWKRQLRQIPSTKDRYPQRIVYQAPCGRYFQKAYDIRRHLFLTCSKLDVDYFSFDKNLNLNRTTLDLHANYYVENIAVDAKTGQPLENKYISLMNGVSEERLPQDFSYVSVTFPHFALKKKNFSFNTEFKSGCDCEDDCQARVSCACHQLNEEAAGKLSHLRGRVDNNAQYKDKRLINQVSTAIFECNSLCNCSSKCSNRVVQNGIRTRLQVNKTLNKGWGVITLDDIPPGAFICTYAAELLDDADQYGDSDMYYADLDYITVNEGIKLGDDDSEKSDEGVEILSDDEYKNPTHDQVAKRKAPKRDESEESEETDSTSISSLEQNGLMSVDDNPRPPESNTSSRYPKRKSNQQNSKPTNNNQHVRKDRQDGCYKRIHDLLNSHDFTLDARMQGNIGRFFNHSCDPNSHAQNVFIETHDLRFPVVAFFSNKLIKAMEEITWNYNYKMGAIEGRRIDCHCGASNCKGRIL